MKKIWLVRHGESKAQTMEQYSFDADLSDLGLAQAQALQEVITEKNINFTEVYISPLKRARQTFDALNINNCISQCELTKTFFDVRLIEEMPAASYQTLLPYEKLADYAPLINTDEWLEPLSQRIESFCDNLVMNDALTDNILIVCHMGVLNHLMKKLQSYGQNSAPNDEFYYFHNCSYSVVEIADDCQCKIIDIDNVNHLREKKLLK